MLLPTTATLLPKNGNNAEATFDFLERTKFYDKLVHTVAVLGNKVEC